MSADDASEAASLLSRRRWGNQAVSRAVATVVARRDELDAEQLAGLASVLGQEAADG